MKHFRRFSIRSLLILVTFVAIYVGYRTNAARQQRRDVAVVRDAGGVIYYDWMLQPVYDAQGNVPYIKILEDPDVMDAPKWMREFLGDEYFQRVSKVHLPANAVDESVMVAMSHFRGGMSRLL
ncbi:hypothetical protein, partial [Aporhodopirellula aestuarii]